MKIGNDFNKLYLGSSEAKKIYLGSSLLWENDPYEWFLDPNGYILEDGIYYERWYRIATVTDTLEWTKPSGSYFGNPTYSGNNVVYAITTPSSNTTGYRASVQLKFNGTINFLVNYSCKRAEAGASYTLYYVLDGTSTTVATRNYTTNTSTYSFTFNCNTSGSHTLEIYTVVRSVYNSSWGAYYPATFTLTLPNSITHDVQIEKKGERIYSTNIPVSNFNYNFNFKLYDTTNKSVHQANNANWKQDLSLIGDPQVTNDHITLNNGNAYAVYIFNNTSENIFNRTTSNPYMTFIAKIGKCSGTDGNNSELFCNNGPDNTGSNNNLNYLIRAMKTSAYLRDGSSSVRSITYNENDTKIIVIRCTTVSGSYVYFSSGLYGSYTLTTNRKYGNLAGQVSFFGRNGNTNQLTIDQVFNGEVYWMFQANRNLSDAEVTQVVNYNENL